MSAPTPYSHAPNFTGYIEIVLNLFRTWPRGLRVLDAPAGAGRLAEAVRKLGNEVICVDINGEKPDYVYADMSKPLPFGDESFDRIVCLEGMEHIMEPAALAGELVRVCRKGGKIVLSTPNIMNAYSRLQFLLTGSFHQFSPALVPAVAPGASADRGHISPITYQHLRYILEHHGARVEQVTGDRYKKKILFPLYALFLLPGLIWTRKLLREAGEEPNGPRNREIFKHILSPPLLFSRSMIVVAERIR